MFHFIEARTKSIHFKGVSLQIPPSCGCQWHAWSSKRARFSRVGRKKVKARECFSIRDRRSRESGTKQRRLNTESAALTGWDRSLQALQQHLVCSRLPAALKHIPGAINNTTYSILNFTRVKTRLCLSFKIF